MWLVMKVFYTCIVWHSSYSPQSYWVWNAASATCEAEFLLNFTKFKSHLASDYHRDRADLADSDAGGFWLTHGKKQNSYLMMGNPSVIKKKKRLEATKDS